MDNKRNYKLIAEYCYYASRQRTDAEWYNSEFCTVNEKIIIHQDFEEAYYFAMNNNDDVLIERINTYKQI